jgi:hypothetical protein
VAGGLTEAATEAGKQAGFLITVSTKYGDLAGKVDKFEQSTRSENGGPLNASW